MTAEPVRAGIYCRLSLATMGDTTKVEDQERISRELCARVGWEVHDVYCDNSKSAWQKNRKRPGWDRMLEDVGAGKITAIVVYHGDRLVRRPQDLGKLMDLADSKGIRLASPTGTRNLDNGDDRFILWIEVAAAERSSYDTSRRKKSQYERWRREGKVRAGGRGGRPFGFEKDGVTHIPEEVAVIRDAARRVLMGESAGSVARSITMLTPAGNQFASSTLRDMLSKPRMAGLMPRDLSKAAWAPVLGRAEWEMVCAVLDNRAAACPRPSNARRWLLSGIAVCGVCWSPLAIRQGSSRKGHPAQIAYECVRPGCKKVSRSAQLLDPFVSGAVVKRLNHPANPEPMLQLADGAAAELAALTRRKAETEEFIAGLVDAPMSRIEVLNRALDGFDAKIAAIREQMAAGAGERLLSAHAGITREGWEALPLDVRRSLVRATFRVIVKPASKRGPGFRPEDVTLAPVTSFL